MFCVTISTARSMYKHKSERELGGEGRRREKGGEGGEGRRGRVGKFNNILIGISKAG